MWSKLRNATLGFTVALCFAAAAIPQIDFLGFRRMAVAIAQAPAAPGTPFVRAAQVTPPAVGDSYISVSRLPTNSAALPDAAWSTAGVRYDASGLVTGDSAANGTVGIPPRLTICSTLGTAGQLPTFAQSVTAATINSAIASCPAGQTVFLNPGTYTINTSITWGLGSEDNVTLRGSGANQTLLNITGNQGCGGNWPAICMRSSDLNYKGDPQNLTNWVGGYTRGTTTIQLAAKTNLALGSVLILDQTDDTSDGNQIYVCSDDPCASDGDGGFVRPGRGQEQIVVVTSIEGGSCAPSCDIGITPGLYMPNWSGSKSPQGWYSSGPLLGAGIEDFSMNWSSANPIAAVEMLNCNGCYVKGIRSYTTDVSGDSNRSHVMLQASTRVTIRDSYFYGQDDWTSGGSEYGIEVHTSNCLVENNIFQMVQAPFVTNGPAEGCVMGYNFAVNLRYTEPDNDFQNQMIFGHAVQSFVLAEGNIGPGAYLDTFHGTHHFWTFFRNRYSGVSPNNGTTTLDATQPIKFAAFSRFNNVICNVLGSDTRPHNSYENSPNQSIYDLGDPHNADDSDGTRVKDSMFRWGNYDTFNNATRWVTGEVPTGESTYPNTVPSTQTCADSFYLSGQPAFWRSGLPFPGIGPDVSGGPSTQGGAGADGHSYNNPAIDCYFNVMSGPTNGTGSVLSFNRTTCYPGS